MHTLSPRCTKRLTPHITETHRYIYPYPVRNSRSTQDQKAEEGAASNPEFGPHGLVAALGPRKQGRLFFSYFFPLSLSVEGSSQPGRRQFQRLLGLPPQRGLCPARPQAGAAWAFPEHSGLLQAVECDRAPAHLTQVTEPPADGALAVGGL